MTETASPRERADQEQPPPFGRFRLPEIPGPVTTAGRAWRLLRRMSTALWLLLAMSVSALIATLIPQEPVIVRTVTQWREGTAGPGRGWARLLDALGLFDVFGSWWFTVLLVLLFVSLTGCLVPRYRAFARVVRRPPAGGRDLDRFAHSAVLSTTLGSDDALAAADRALRGWRRRRLTSPEGGDQLAAERGHWREGGSLLFHTAFYLLLVGVVSGHAFGFTGQINVVEGSSFAETRIVYDAARPGRFWDAGDHRGFVTRLDDFDVSYHPDFTPADFVSTVTIIEDGREVRTEHVRVNHPLVHDGMKLFQARFGMAPRIVVRTAPQGGAPSTVLFDEPVMLTQDGPFWIGRAKVSVGNPAADPPVPQIALDVALVPDAQLVDGELTLGSPEPLNPRLALSLYVADDLGLERPEPLSRLAFEQEDLVAQVMLAEGASEEIAGGRLVVEFPDLAMWSGFQVSHAPGRRLLLIAGGLLLAGLIPSLYSYRRRIWVEARPREDGTDVVLAGVALQRKPAFAEDFDRLRSSLATALQPVARHSDVLGPSKESVR